LDFICKKHFDLHTRYTPAHSRANSGELCRGEWCKQGRGEIVWDIFDDVRSITPGMHVQGHRTIPTRNTARHRNSLGQANTLEGCKCVVHSGETDPFEPIVELFGRWMIRGLAKRTKHCLTLPGTPKAKIRNRASSWGLTHADDDIAFTRFNHAHHSRRHLARPD
jgi:hypothetical protein